MEIKQILLDAVQPSPLNPRKTFDEEALAELADNIEKQGLLQPITVRPIANKETGESYEIVCGERRYRAICILKAKEDAANAERIAAHRKKFDSFQTINAIVRDMTDEEAFDAMITENLQRKDVDPIEEAFAFSKLLETGKTVEEIAARFGKSTRFVQDRCKLNNLIPELMVAIKDNKCSISAAMVICKLKEEHQRRWYTQTTNSYYDKELSKSSAISFVNKLFMKLEDSPWYNNDNQNDENFEGGCGKSCGQCQYNTNNYGCLFWEMKAEDDGKCTNREMFNKKNIAYVMHLIEHESENFVKAGQPLEFGKTVVICDKNNCSTEGLREAVLETIKSSGYEVVNPNDLFQSKCWYNENDERLEDLIKSGNVYRCFRFMRYNGISPEIEYWYHKNTSEKDNTENPQSVEAMNLVQKHKRNRELYKEKVTTDLRALADDKIAKNYISALNSQPLSDLEKAALLTIIVKETGRRLDERVPEILADGNELLKWLHDNPEKHPLIIREYMREYVASNSVNYDSRAQAAQRALMSYWLSDKAEEILTKHQDDLDKKQVKVAEKLEALGYDTDGQLKK